MITKALNTEIRLNDTHRHKFFSAMAAYLYEIEDDEWTGSTEWTEYVQRFGKRLLFTDDRGFVTDEKYPTVDAAISRFYEIDAKFGDWVNAEGEWT